MEEQPLCMLMQTIQEFAQKSNSGSNTLAEYEVLLYESLCDWLKNYARFQEVQIKLHILKHERAEMEEREHHEKWMKEHGRETSGDQETGI